MKIQKFSPDGEGIIYIRGVVRMLTMGLQNSVVTIWAVTDPGSQFNMMFAVKEDGDKLTKEDTDNYLESFINADACWHLIALKQKLES